ncbi:MAG: SDR family oxidoreductase [Proteobacteria bacterium]|nr:SDR family oxidoreductase [Pseudomonadota bacterium]
MASSPRRAPSRERNKTPPKVFITGASSGLGAALARRYAGRGAVLGLAARRGVALEALAGELSATCHIYPLDVTDAPALVAAGADFIARAGVPDIVIANAGISLGTLTEEAADLQAFARVMQANVLGMVHTFHPFVAAMKQAGQGRLVGISSVAGIRGMPGAGAYCASKAAANTYLESLRVELRGSGVGVTNILPGYIATPMTAVNQYTMPFILSADEAARRIVRQIDRGARYAVVPWQMAVVAKLLRMLPDPLFDRLFARAGRKQRQIPL